MSDETRQHVASADCWCKPEVEGVAGRTSRRHRGSTAGWAEPDETKSLHALDRDHLLGIVAIAMEDCCSECADRAEHIALSVVSRIEAELEATS